MKVDSIISLPDNEFTDFPPKHPIWKVACIQQDGRWIRASFNGMIPKGIRWVSATFLFITINHIC